MLQNKGYVKDAETEVNRTTSGLELPTVTVRGSSTPSTRRSSTDSRHSHDGADGRSRQTVHVAEVHRESELPSEVQVNRKRSLTSTSPPAEGDGFPWTPPKNDDSAILTIHSESHGAESRDSQSPEQTKKAKKCSQQFWWWHKLVKILQDNRVQSQDTHQKLLLLDQMQETHLRLVKRIMNLMFLSLGMILLLAVIVLIVYTDPRFEESMKALTVFMAGRRRGLW